MKARPLAFAAIAERISMLALMMFFCAAAVFAQAQASTADLRGTIVDPNGAVVPGANVTARNAATGITRTVVSNDEGVYQIFSLPPGEYEVSAEAATFKKVVISSVRLTVGQSAELPIKLEIGASNVVVNVSGESVDLVETSRTTVSNTIDQARIENLPINERSATGFALTISTVGRDNGRPVGPAPTSGLNIGGQRGRSTLVQVDGSDFTDNSVNAARSTVSQEAVQEFQVATNSYAPEFGRATGGIINVVTKRGTNDFSGNVFGFIRDKKVQARNPFAPFKSAFTRTQSGATLGGRIIRDKTFFFAAFERRQRNETGFFTSNVIGEGTNALTGSASIPVIPGFNPVARTFTNITAQQAAFINGFVTQGSQLLAAGQVAAAAQLLCAARAYAFFASSGGNTALNGTNTLTSSNDGSACPAISPIAPGTIGSRFLLTGAPVPVGTTNAAGQPIAFRPLLGLQRVFPVTDRTNYFSIRGDHNINNDNQFVLRFGYNPSTITGIQVESQNQSLGQNDFSRTGIQTLKDTSFTAGLNSTLTGATANEFRFSYGRRHATFRSQSGDAVAFNISGAAFIGRELFSPVDRTEIRYQFADNFNYVLGNHTFKFGGDINFIKIPAAVFELNFAGLFNFGDFAASNLGFPASAPAFTPVQSYGLGLPSTYIQGFGNPISQIKNKPVAFFAQDSWKATRRLTINYGIRYDIEFTQQIAPVAFRDPLSGINLSDIDILAAQDAIGVQQGFPRDKNNFAPRFGFAYDIFGDGKTVVRGALGLFYDHPLLAVAFNSDIADAAQQQQAVLTAGSPTPTALLNAAQVFQGTVCGVNGSVAAICGAAVTPGVSPTAEYQFGRQRFNDQTFPGFGTVLPFTLPVSKDFQYASATQANLSFERELTKNMSLSASYIFVGAHHLPHPTDLNTPNTALQIQNFQRYSGGRLPGNTQEAVALSIPTVCPTAPAGFANPLPCLRNNQPIAAGTALQPGDLFPNFTIGPTGTPLNQYFATIIPGIITAPVSNLANRVISPAVANFFRPSAPNYFLAQALTRGAVNVATLNAQLAGTLRTPGTVSPFGSVNAQVSDGNSNYNALNVELKRRFANNFTFLASYTLSHSIDDSSDLQTLLIAQDPNNFRAERANSLFDQRHRFVFSGVLASPAAFRSASGFMKRFLADFSVAPILEISSGRPFNIITNVDANNDQTSQTDRPNVFADGSLCVPGSTTSGGVCGSIFTTNAAGATVFSTGSLGRNRGLTHSFASLDMRITRAIRFSERIRLDLIVEGFNLFNRFNEAAASPNFGDVNAFGQRASGGQYYSRPTAAFDPRQFQFGAKLNF
ncbi:MAG: carboxypeptidase-like regulatory domain-containing protein [Acidobacteriota bacterium]|nr:carboxypeptidase-like regulatory domain-containing protein [Acidobacteriota bacterium]